MKLYIVIYDYPNWKIETLNDTDIKLFGRPYAYNPEIETYARYKKDVGIYGDIYHRSQIYTTMEAAQDYIDGYSLRAKKYQWAGNR